MNLIAGVTEVSDQKTGHQRRMLRKLSVFTRGLASIEPDESQAHGLPVLLGFRSSYEMVMTSVLMIPFGGYATGDKPSSSSLLS